MNERLGYELFHIVHSTIWNVNEKRNAENKILILDKEIWDAIQEVKLDLNIFIHLKRL
jgi:hypothetical protein